MKHPSNLIGYYPATTRCPYTPPTTLYYALCTMHSLCASGTPKSGTVTFGVRVDNTDPVDLYF